MTQTIINVPAAFDPTDITLTDDTSGALLIKEGSNEYMRIDTTNGSEQIIMKGRPGLNSKLVLNNDPYIQGPSNNYIQFTNSQIVINQGSVTNTRHILGSVSSANSWRIRNSGGQDIVTVNAAMQSRIRAQSFIVSDKNTDTPMFEMDDSTNATFTLDSSSTCNFKVVDDAGTPVTYLDIERGSAARVKIPNVGLENIRAISGAFTAVISSTAGIRLVGFPLNYEGVAYTYDQSDDGTSKNIGVKPSYTVRYSSAASGAATTGITLQLSTPAPLDGIITPQYLVLQNQNATHSAKFIVDPTGSYTGKEVATSGTDAADLIGSGFTLAAGKFAVFSILACRVENTGGHYFYAVSLHTKT